MTPDPDHGVAARGPGSGGDLMERAVDGAVRLGRAWKAMSRERRMAAIAAAILWLSLFLPWYQYSAVIHGSKSRNPVPVSASLSGWAAFGLVEALVLILSLGMLLVLFLRAEGRMTHLPGGDGWTVTLTGVLGVFLVMVGLFNVPSPASHGQYVLSTGLEWGIFVALLAAGGLTWAGARIRGSLEDDPLLAGKLRGEAASPPSHAPWPAEEPAAPEKPARPAEPSRSEEPTRLEEPGRTEKPSGDGAKSPTPVAAPGPAPGSGAGAGAGAGAGVGADAGEPVTAAAATQVVAPEPDQPEADRAEPSPRSSWRPAERPAWTDPERPMGWLTAPPQHVEQDEPDDEAGTEPHEDSGADQLTLRLEQE